MMARYINADRVNASLDRIREEVWLNDIPSPTVPEYIEHHETMQRLMLVIDKERERLDDAAADVAPVRHGRLTINHCKVGGYDYSYYKCTACGRLRPLTPFQFDFCPFCGAKMDQGDNDGEVD